MRQGTKSTQPPRRWSYLKKSCLKILQKIFFPNPKELLKKFTKEYFSKIRLKQKARSRMLVI
jgi:hypothetical protein